MRDRVVYVALCAMPCAGAPVQLRAEPVIGALELASQQVAKQVVIPEPVPAIVERHQEQVRALNLL